MNIDHHPSDNALMAFAAGTLWPAGMIVVSAHVEHCTPCKKDVARFEDLNAVLFENSPPQPFENNALESCIKRIEDITASRSDTFDETSLSDKEDKMAAVHGIALPRALKGLTIGHWRWLAPGTSRAIVYKGDGKGAKAYLLRVEKGRALPRHGHGGEEMTYVLKGAFLDEGIKYTPGDFFEIDETKTHRPIVEESEDCICLIAEQRAPKLKFFEWVVESVLGIRNQEKSL